MGIIVSDSGNPSTAEETHYYNFTEENFKQFIESKACLTIKEYGVCILNWSFYCIVQKKDRYSVENRKAARES